MAKLMTYLSCQVLLGILVVKSSILHSADNFRTKRRAVKPWSSLATCLAVQTKKGSGRARTMLAHIRDNTLVVELTPVSNAKSSGSFSPYSGPCRFQRGFTKDNVNRRPNVLSRAVCTFPRCDPNRCIAVTYNVPVLKKKSCKDANVWFRATEVVTVAYVPK